MIPHVRFDPAVFMRQLRMLSLGADAVASPEEPRASRDSGTRLSIDLQGPFDSSFSLAIVNRRLAAALDRLTNVSVRLSSMDATAPLVGNTAGLRDRDVIERLANRPHEHATHLIRNMYPPLLHDLDGRTRNYFYFAWEDSRIPADWAQAFNRHLDGVLVPTAHVRNVLARSGVAIPTGVVPYGVEISAATQTPALHTRGAFRFLHVSTGFPRKGCDVLIRAFTREFSNRDKACLVIKTLPQYDHSVRRQVRMRRLLPGCPEIVHIDQDLDEASMRGLYGLAGCLVHSARAEGFGLPIAEAMLARIPVIVTNFSGPADFCSGDTAVLVGCRRARSRSPFVVKGAEWGEPDQRELQRAMRLVYERPDAPEVRRRVARAEAHVTTYFTWDRAADRAVRFMRAVDTQVDRPVRAAMVTTWNERCGIAEYSRELIASLPVGTADWSIFAAATDAPTRPDTAATTRCWRNATPTDFSAVIDNAARRRIDVVHFQTHLTMWGPVEAGVLTALKRDGRRVFMTLHSVLNARPGAEVVQALRGVDRILVHTDEARERLRPMGLETNVTTLAHAFPAASAQDRDRLRARLELGGAPVIGTFGFLRSHKGVLELIHALPLLKRRFPRVFLLGLTALYPSKDSEDYLRVCDRAIDRLGLHEHCGLVTDFLSPEDVTAAMQLCDVVALPYRPTIDSSSGAVHVALASQRPVLTTAVSVFAELEEAVLQIERPSPHLLARGITTLLENRELAASLARNASAIVSRHSREVIGRTYAKILRAAVTDLSEFARPYPIETSLDEPVEV